MKSGAVWPMAIIGVLGLTVVANVFLWRAANAPGSNDLEPDYYHRALAWDSTQAARVRSASLGWRAQASLGLGRMGNEQLHVTITGQDGAPVAGAQVQVLGVHNLDPGHPERWTLIEQPEGRYVADVHLPHTGRWELRVNASRGDERFESVEHAEALREGTHTGGAGGLD
jgi:nitrogen fixation protein FixH